MNKQTLRVDEGTSVALCVFEPEGAPRASVVIGGAFGVRQGYYASFAQWLAWTAPQLHGEPPTPVAP